MPKSNDACAAGPWNGTVATLLGASGPRSSQGRHQIERVGYIAALESFASIRSRVRRRLEALARRGERYAVLGHSLGGLTLRSALIDLAPAPVRLIMLATPNQSPQLARRLQRFWPYRLLTGETGQLLASDKFFRQLPPPLVPYIIIAGSAGPRGRWSPFHNEVNDWLVAVEETKLVPATRPSFCRWDTPL